MRDNQKFVSWEEAVRWLIQQPDKQDLVINSYFDMPLIAAANRYLKSEEWQEIKAYLPSNKVKALDIGAGRGITSYALAKEGWNVSALEPDPSYLVGNGAISKLAIDAQLPIEVFQEWGECLPFKNETFDLVIARQVLHHAKDLKKFNSEIYRVMKPGGVFLAIRDHVISSSRDLDKFLNSHPLHKFYGGENAYPLQDYIQAIQSSCLRIKKKLSPLGSVINYAPMTKQSLKDELIKKINAYPFGKFFSAILRNELFFRHFIKLLSGIDRRPGRLYSFICYKPEIF